MIMKKKELIDYLANKTAMAKTKQMLL